MENGKIAEFSTSIKQGIYSIWSMPVQVIWSLVEQDEGGSSKDYIQHQHND